MARKMVLESQKKKKIKIGHNSIVYFPLILNYTIHLFFGTELKR